MSCGISSSFPEVFPTSGQVTHVLLTRPPLDWRELPPSASFDLHVLSTPPAFILSQDQTLHLKCFARLGRLAAASPVEIRVESCCVLKTLVFPKNQEKDVWHALLSFQGTASPELAASLRTRDGAVPPAPSPNQSDITRTDQNSDLWFPCQAKFRFSISARGD